MGAERGARVRGGHFGTVLAAETIAARARRLNSITLLRVSEDRADLEMRIVDLELRFMRQEKLSDELSQVVADQQREIGRLALEVRTLREQVLAGIPALAKDERPPHY